MTDDQRDLAVLKQRVDDIKEDVSELKGNQKWAVLTLIGLVIKTAFDYITKGGGQ